MNKDTIKQDSSWVKFEDHMLNDGVSNLRTKKLQVMYKFVLRHITKPLDKLTRADIELFITDLNRNRIQKVRGGNVSGSTKADIKKFLRQYFKWLKGNNETFPKEVAWLKTRIRKDERPEQKDVITDSQVIKLANRFTKPEFRIITLLLFDSGFRISEMLSAKKEDLRWEEDGDESCYWIKCRESKTIAREVPIPLFTDEINEFKKSIYYQALEGTDTLFKISYDYYNRALAKYSKELFNKHMTPHGLRHSSATYYSKELDGNFVQISNRYGWTLSSDQMKLISGTVNICKSEDCKRYTKIE